MNKQYQVGISQNGKYVYVCAIKCPINLQLASAFTKDFVSLGERSGIYKCICDMRGTMSQTGVFGQYEFAYKVTSSIPLSRKWKIAILKDCGDKTVDFLDVVMKNAGFNFEVFENEYDAVSWLE